MGVGFEEHPALKAGLLTACVPLGRGLMLPDDCRYLNRDAIVVAFEADRTCLALALRKQGEGWG